MVGFDEKEWFFATQSTSLTFIASQIFDSGLTAWGTDGTSLFPLFHTPSTALTKTFTTKMYGGEREYITKEPLVVYMRATDKSAGQNGINGTIVMEAEGIATQDGQQPQLLSTQFPVQVQPSFSAPNGSQPIWAAAASSVHGTAIGATFVSNSPDFVISGLSIAYRDVEGLFG
jgi:hypothetical protein